MHKRKRALFYEQQHGLMSMKAGLTYQRDVSEQKPILTEIWCESYWLRETIWVSFYLHEKEKLKSIKKTQQHKERKKKEKNLQKQKHNGK